MRRRLSRSASRRMARRGRKVRRINVVPRVRRGGFHL